MNTIHQFFTKQVAYGVLRLVLGYAGAVLVKEGLVDGKAWASNTDAIITGLAGIWTAGVFLYGVWTNTRAGLMAKTEALPGVDVVPAPGFDPARGEGGNGA